MLVVAVEAADGLAEDFVVAMMGMEDVVEMVVGAFVFIATMVVGIILGATVNTLVGFMEGIADVAFTVGAGVAMIDGAMVDIEGVAVGVMVGVFVGIVDGDAVGIMVGIDGLAVGVAVGVTVGVFVGIVDGVAVGVTVGVFVGIVDGAAVGVD